MTNAALHHALAPKPSTGPRCVFLNTYYDAFLRNHYGQHPELSTQPFAAQLRSLQDQCFGDSDFYSSGLKQAGWEAVDLIINCAPLQEAWALENAAEARGLAIVVEQIRRLQPDVVYFQDLGWATTDLLAAIRPHTRLIVGQIASPLPPQADLSRLDIIFSSFPHFVDRFRQHGLTSHYQPLAFEPRVMDKLGERPWLHPVTFVGGISSAHGKGLEFLETLAGMVPMDFWGYGAASLPAHSPIKQRHHGEAWGLEMFGRLNQSLITVNRHIDVAENYANNMRLFEATGCGALLLTDYKDNLSDLFTIGQEVVAYRDAAECAALIAYYLAHPDEAAAIAQAGQERTLRDHTYGKRMEQTAEILDRHLRYQHEREYYPAPDMRAISSGYRPLEAAAIPDHLASSWTDPAIPARQRALTQQELGKLYRGEFPQVFQVLAETIAPAVRLGSSLLEIGCSSGYYYEALEYLLKTRLSYTGVDISEAFIAMAQDYYPNANFVACDGAHMPFDDRCFDIVVSSCVLLHVPNYREHIRETVRVAKEWVVAHRTPICRRSETRYYTKQAYGVETVELCFNEAEFVAAFEACGLRLVQTLEYQSAPAEDRFDVTYLFRRISERGPHVLG